MRFMRSTGSIYLVRTWGMVLCIVGVVLCMGYVAWGGLPPAPPAAAAPLLRPPAQEPPPEPSPPPPPTAVPATPTPAQRIVRPGEPAPIVGGDLVMRTYSMDFYRVAGSLNAEGVRAIAIPAEYALIRNSAYMNGSQLDGRVVVRFEPEQQGACAIRGMTLSQHRIIRMYYGPDASLQGVLAILSHELFHQLQHDYYGEEAHRRADIILLEGMAAWGSDRYFRAAGMRSFRGRVRDALRSETLLSLTTSLEDDCRTTTRNVLYDEWASFVEYLILTYGRESFDHLYVSSTGRAPGSSDYQGVYGKTLAQLETEWMAWLDYTTP